jgi:hypothetical protein
MGKELADRKDDINQGSAATAFRMAPATPDKPYDTRETFVS